MNPPDWQAAVEIHPRDWVCPTEPYWVAGWVSSPAGLVPWDIRARVGDRVFLGLCGLPRPDRQSPPGAPGPGFSFYLHPVAGARDLRIELCDQYGRWTEIFQQTLTSPPRTSVAPPESSLHDPDTDLLLDLLRARHVRPHLPWSALADELLLARRAEFIDIMPSEPFKGALEQLETRVAVHYDHVLITGWVAHRSQRITRLIALLDSARPLPLLHGLDRPDAGQMFADYVDAAQSRFAGYLRLPGAVPRPLSLRIFAETTDGQTTLVFLKRIHPVLVSGAGTDLPPLSRVRFLQAANALNRAVWHRSWLDRAWHEFLRNAWQAYRAGVPARRLPTPPPDPTATASKRPLRLTLVTHNLNFEGAPLFLLEFALHLAAQRSCTIQVVAAADGPLRARYEAAGIPVTVATPAVPLHCDDDGAFDAALHELGRDVVWREADLIVANTLLSFWAVLLALQLGKRSVYYLHESAGARRFFALDFTTKAVCRVEKAIAEADRVVFPANDGRRAHAYLDTRRHFRALPGWVDVARIDAYQTNHDRGTIRAELNLPANSVVFAHIGSLLARKGVHLYVEAIRTLLREAPKDIPLIFLLVGAKSGPDPYADIVRHTIAELKGADIRIIPQASDPYRYFFATDIFVCASLEEVFPRVVLEAAVFARSIVTTNVNGIPEMLGEKEAWLVPPDNAAALAEAMGAALAAHRRGDRTRAQRARKRVTSHFDTAVMLPRHAGLIHHVAAGPTT